MKSHKRANLANKGLSMTYHGSGIGLLMTIHIDLEMSIKSRDIRPRTRKNIADIMENADKHSFVVRSYCTINFVQNENENHRSDLKIGRLHIHM